MKNGHLLKDACLVVVCTILDVVVTLGEEIFRVDGVDVPMKVRIEAAGQKFRESMRSIRTYWTAKGD